MNNYVFYDTPVNEYHLHYQKTQFPFSGGEIKTQLSKNLAIIRTIALAVFTALTAFLLRSSLLYWPAVLTGIAFLAHTVKTQFLSKDPLLEAFYKIFGGQAKFNQLPDFKLNIKPQETLFSAIYNLKWEDLKDPIAKAKTLDGRTVLIVKGLSRNIEEKKCQVKKIFAFVEKFEVGDVDPSASSNIGHSLVYALKPYEKSAARVSSSSGNKHFFHRWEKSHSITSEMANELFAQV